MNDEIFDLDELAQEAYIFFYPLVMAAVTREVMTSGPDGQSSGRGPANTFHHVRSFPTADFRDVVRPNFDTLYSLAWLDLDAEPMVVTVPPTPDRYILLPCYDLWSDVFAVPGTRTLGEAGYQFALCGPNFTGAIPEGIHRIDAPTNEVFIIGRTQTNGTNDYEAVHAVQDGLVVEPLSHLGQGPQPSPETPKVTGPDPMKRVNAMDAATFFELAANRLTRNPPHDADWSQMARLARLGIVPGRSFSYAEQSPDVRAALDTAPSRAMGYMVQRFPTMAPLTNGWVVLRDTMGSWGTFYLKRALIALVGLGANPVEDAVYPILQIDADGNKPDGTNRYVLRFAPDAFPPVDAFWSLTMYDAVGYQVANDLQRFALGDRDVLTYDADGSLSIYIQNERPEDAEVANWLPAPAGAMGLTLRLYLPRESVLSGAWVPPPLTRR